MAPKLTLKKSEDLGSVNTLRGFVSKILSLEKQTSCEVFYRGHSDALRYRLEPSIFRKKENKEYLYKDNEHVLYRELIISNPDDFIDDTYTLDKLIRMQHYSLPTRLLDITTNPLIALYFSCKTNATIEGEVIILTIASDKIKYYDSDTASCLANIARLPKSEKDGLNIYLDDNEFNKLPSVKRLLHLIKEEKPFFEPNINARDLEKIICVKGKKSNARISSQSGAFLLFGVEHELNKNGNSDIDIKRLKINGKEDIIKELDMLNINESTVFPYIENSAKYLANKYSK